MKARLPKCADCGCANPHAVLRNPDWPDYGYTWLCGSCEYRRLNPDARPYVPLPHERRAKPVQKERLFDVEILSRKDAA